MLFLRDHKALSPSKHNQVCVDGQPHKSFRPAPAPSPISGSNEVTKRQCPLLPLVFMVMAPFQRKEGQRHVDLCNALLQSLLGPF